MKNVTPMPRDGMPDMNENDLLADVKNSIMAMQQQMQAAYTDLDEEHVNGKSNDGLIEIILTATNQFVDLKINPRAFANADGKFSQKEFEKRLREAWKNVTENIKKVTQSKTLEMLQSMDIPEEIRNLSVDQQEEGDK